MKYSFIRYAHFLAVMLVIYPLFLFVSCKKFVEVPPPSTEITGETVFSSDATAVSAIAGIYSQMLDGYPHFANGSITLFAGLSSDEFNDYSGSGSQPEFYQNSLTANNGYVLTIWSDAYKYIYNCNAILEGLQSSTGISQTIRLQLQGEAQFIRAFCHFYLLNLFGEIPFITTTDYRQNTSVGRMSVDKVYEDIITDLENAYSLLNEDYNMFAGERVRPTKAAASALLARVYLYTEDWAKALLSADRVISNTELYALPGGLNEVFLKNSSEAIWQLSLAEGHEFNTYEGNHFILTSAPTSVDLNSALLAGFEPGDLRRTEWIVDTTFDAQPYSFAYKYKVKSGPDRLEYYMILRLGEQYLIRAEANANVGNLTEAVQDINTLRQRAALPVLSDLLSQEDVLAAIQKERRSELFAEWGHRWFDLKRTNKVDEVMTFASATKGGVWNSFDQFYPIPLSQLQNDNNMAQTPGY